MSQPASKEPSMDEILSSIRQIIADDDAASAARAQQAPTRPAAPVITTAARPSAPKTAAGASHDKPLALNESQIVSAKVMPIEDDLDDLVAAAEQTHGGRATQFVIPNDVSYDREETPEPAAAPRAEPKPMETVVKAQASSPSPLPDPSLSADLADQLLTPAADMATRSAFSQLNAVALPGKQRSVEDLIREMLRPMLKTWLDENLPGMVERMVQREIERISRNGR